MESTSKLEPKRQISSSFTFIAKLILPSIFYGGLIIALFGLISEKQYGGALAAFFVLLSFGTIIYLGFVRLMSVDLDNQYLYISNYFKTIKVPTSQLCQITQLSIPGNYRPITIRFKNDTGFGLSIMFLNSSDSTFSSSESSIVEELRILIQKNNSE